MRRLILNLNQLSQIQFIMASQTIALTGKQLQFAQNVTPPNNMGAPLNVKFLSNNEKGAAMNSTQSSNAEIKGRRVESPKIYVVSERPLTSTQVTRKSNSSQNNTAPVPYPQNSKKPKKAQEVTELCTTALAQPRSFLMHHGPKTKKDQSSKFDFNFNSSKEGGSKQKGSKQASMKAQAQFVRDFIKMEDLQQPRTTTNFATTNLNNSGPISLPQSRTKVAKPNIPVPSAYQQKRQQAKTKDQNSNFQTQIKASINTSTVSQAKRQSKRTKSEAKTNQSTIAAVSRKTQKKPKIAAIQKTNLNRTTLLAPTNLSGFQAKVKSKTQFSFEFDQENSNKHTNKSQQKSVHAVNRRKEALLSGCRNDLSISTLSSNKSIGTNNASGNLSKLITKKNYFVDGEKLLRQFSPDSPDTSPPRDNCQELINLINHSTVGAGQNKHSNSESRKAGQQRKKDHDESSISNSYQRSRAKAAAKNFLSHDMNNSLDLGLSSEDETRLMFDRAEKDRLAATQGQLSIQKQLTGFEIPLNNGNSNVSAEVTKSAKQLNLTQKSFKKDKGLDKLVKNNLRKKNKQDAEQMLKKFMEETQKKQKKLELSQRNLEIKKLNAARAKPDDEAEKHRIQQMLAKANEKKKRSKSCINKSDNIFGAAQIQNLIAREERDKSNETNKIQYSILAANLFDNKVKDRSCLGQISKLKREVNNEINRELKEGLIEFIPKPHGPSTTTNKKAGKMTAAPTGKKRLHNKEEQFSMTNPNPLNRNTFTSLRRGEADLLLERNNGETEGTIKSRSRKTALVSKAMNTSKIQRFIERQKRKQKALKSLERSLENEKHRKIRQQLQDLHAFTRGDRKKGQALRQHHNYPSINIKKIMNDPANSSHQQLQLLEHVRNTLPRKNFKAHQNVSKGGKKHKIDLTISNPKIDEPISDDDQHFSQSYKNLKHNIKQDLTLVDEIKSMAKDFNVTSVKNSTLHRETYLEESKSRSHSESRVDQTVLQAPPLKELQIHTMKPTQLLVENRLNMSHGNKISLENSIVPSIEANQRTTNKHQPVSSDAFSSLIPKEHEGVSGNSGPLGQSEFESLEAVRIANQRAHQSHTDNETISAVNERTVSPPRRVYEDHVRELTEKYPSAKAKRMSESKKLIHLHSSAILIQHHIRKHLQRNGFYDGRQGIPPFERQDSNFSDNVLQQKPEVSISRIDSMDNTNQSMRKTMIPTLNLDQLAVQKEARNSERDPGTATSRSKSIFEKTPFQDVLAMKGFEHLGEFNPTNFPEMLRCREEAIKIREKSEGSYIKKMFNQNKFSPRTYQSKRDELEKWVTKERENVCKTQKAFEEEWEKTAKLIAATQKNYEIVQGIFQEEGRTSSRLNHHATHQMSSNRNDSARTGPLNLLDEMKAISARSYKNGVINSNRGAISKRGEQSQILDLIYQQEKPQTRARVNSADEPQLSSAKKRDLLDTKTESRENQSQNSNYFEDDNGRAPETELEELASPADLEALKKLDNLDFHVETQKGSLNTRNISSDLYSGSSQKEKNLNIQSPHALLSEPAMSHNEVSPNENLHSFEKPLDRYLLNKILKNASTDDELEGEIHHELETRSPPMKIQDETNSNLDKTEKGLHRVTSYKQLQDQDGSDQAAETPKQLKRLIDSKNTRDSGNLFDNEDELRKQIMEISPATSEQNLKNELKESLKSDHFFLNKMDSNTDYEGEVNELFKNDDFDNEPREKKDLKISKPAPEKQLAQISSPLSNDSVELGIMRGSVSLESSTSQDTKTQLVNAIKEAQQEAVLVKDEDQDQPSQNTTATANKSAEPEATKFGSKEFNDFIFGDQEPKKQALTREQEAFGEALTDELMQHFLAEMKHEMDLVVNRNGQNQDQDIFRGQGQGIKTDLFAIEKYVDEVLAEISTAPSDLEKSLSEPLSKKSLELLNQLQNSEIGSCEHFEEKYPQVLPLDLYLVLEKRRKEKREKEIEAEIKERGEMSAQQQILKTFLAECEHIHNKVLFDCINDSLLQFKPFGKEGLPLPWSRSNRRLKPSDDFQVTEIFEIVKHDLFRWAITQSGTLPRREFLYQGMFDEELFAEIREKKLVGLLAREMIENEPKWLNYEFEQTQVKIDIGDMILEHLVNETIGVLKQNANRDFTAPRWNRSSRESEGSVVKGKASPGISDRDFSRGSQSPGSLQE